MDCMMRMRRIRILDRMNEFPELSRKLGIKDGSYKKKKQEKRR